MEIELVSHNSTSDLSRRSFTLHSATGVARIAASVVRVYAVAAGLSGLYWLLWEIFKPSAWWNVTQDVFPPINNVIGFGFTAKPQFNSIVALLLASLVLVSVVFKPAQRTIDVALCVILLVIQGLRSLIESSHSITFTRGIFEFLLPLLTDPWLPLGLRITSQIGILTLLLLSTSCVLTLLDVFPRLMARSGRRSGTNGQIVNASAAGKSQASQQIPAGWYRNANAPSIERYWDGEYWTEHTRPCLR